MISNTEYSYLDLKGIDYYQPYAGKSRSWRAAHDEDSMPARLDPTSRTTPANQCPAFPVAGTRAAWSRRLSYLIWS